MSVSVSDLNPDFLPLIYDIIRRFVLLWFVFILSSKFSDFLLSLFSIEKDTHDNNPAQKILMPAQQSSTDMNAKMSQLKELFTEFRSTVPKIPGSGTSKDEQLQVLSSLRQQLIMKKQLLMKYKNNSIFDNLNKQQLMIQQSQNSGNQQNQSSYSGQGNLDSAMN